MNNREREQWIDNDEGLYNWRRYTKLSMRAFIRQHHVEIDAAINRVLEPPKSKQWWEYGG